MKKADAMETLEQVIRRVGLLFNKPPGVDRSAVL